MTDIAILKQQLTRPPVYIHNEIQVAYIQSDVIDFYIYVTLFVGGAQLGSLEVDLAQFSVALM